MTDTLLRLRGVAKHYPRTDGLRRVIGALNFDVRIGERVALVGPNGSGKTTLLRILLGVERPDSGAVEFTESPNGNVGYIPQDYRNALFPWFNLTQNLTLGERHASGVQPFVDQFVAFASELRLDFNLSRRTSELSGGEQQLFLLVRTLIRKPRFLVLDEPLSAIDYARKEIIRNYLGRYLAEHRTTFVFASHEFDDAVLLSDRILVLAREAEGVKVEIPVKLPWPRTIRDRDNPVFRKLLSRVMEAVL